MSFFKPKSEPRSLEEMFTPKENENEEDCKTEEEIESEHCDLKVEKFNIIGCFGWEEEKTDKWLIKCAKIWYALASFLWFIFGSVTFAPVIFISSKISSILPKKMHRILASFGIYVLIIFLSFLILK